VCRTRRHAAGCRCRARHDKGRVAITQAAAAAKKRAFAAVGGRALASMARWRPNEEEDATL